MSKHHPILIADIGGTNARFAVCQDKAPWFHDAQTLQCVDHASIFDAIDTYLKNHDTKQLQAICFAVAGPIQNEAVKFLNNDWSVSAAELKSRYAIEQVRLLNDFEAISFSLSSLRAGDVLRIGEGSGEPKIGDQSVAVVGPGSGLGVGGLNIANGEFKPIATEGGHVGFAPDSKLQSQILHYLQGKFGRVSNERLLSGPGLVNIHESLCAIGNIENPGLTPADIAVASRKRTDDLCVQTMQLFFEILGQVAGDTSLALGAYDGVFIGGGIAQRYPNQLQRSKFRAGFENKGRYQNMMSEIPTWLITHKNPGLLGAAVYARQYLSV